MTQGYSSSFNRCRIDDKVARTNHFALELSKIPGEEVRGVLSYEENPLHAYVGKRVW